MRGEPAVSVVIPARDAERWLADALESVLTQTFAELEVIVVDDASTDATPDVLARCVDPRLRTYRLETHAGVAEALNRALKAARGRYVARMDADDVSLPDRLAVQVAFLEDHVSVGIVGGNMRPIDGSGAVVGDATDVPTSPGHIGWMLHARNCVNHPTVVARRDVLLRLGGYRAAAVPAEDYDLFVRAARITELASVSDVVLLYRVHPESTSSVRSRAMTEAADLVAEGALADLLGEAPDRSALEILRRPGQAAGAPMEAVRGAVDLLWRSADESLGSGAVTQMERAAIRRSAVGWFEQIVRTVARDHPLAALALVPSIRRPIGWLIRERRVPARRR
jgi:hypothetical protein